MYLSEAEGTNEENRSSRGDMIKYKGNNGYIILCDKGVFVSRGLRGILFGGRLVPYEEIKSVQYKRAGLFAGYIRLSPTEKQHENFGGFTDPDAIFFNSKQNPVFIQLLNKVELLIDLIQSTRKAKGDAFSLPEILPQEYVDVSAEELCHQSNFKRWKKAWLGH